MSIRNSRLAAAFLAASVVFSAAPSRAAVLSGVQLYWASGPVALLTGQTANACATNPEDSPISVLIALLSADNGSLLASRQVALQPGMGACVAYTHPVPQQGILSLQLSPNVYAVVIQGGRLESTGRIVQDRPGGGACIVASLQIQLATPNNTPGQTILFAQMLEYRDAMRQKGE